MVADQASRPGEGHTNPRPVVERGTHDELVAVGVYARLYESWLGYIRT